MFRRIYVVLSLSLLAVSAAVAQTSGTIINRGCSRQRRSRSIMLNKFVSGASGRWRATPRVHSNSPVRGESFGSVSLAGSIFAIVFAMLWAASLSAQTSGQISGHVSDSTGAVIPKVAITLTNAATGAARSTVTTSSGDYTFPDVQPGTYKPSSYPPGL